MCLVGVGTRELNGQAGGELLAPQAPGTHREIEWKALYMLHVQHSTAPAKPPASYAYYALYAPIFGAIHMKKFAICPDGRQSISERAVLNVGAQGQT